MNLNVGTYSGNPAASHWVGTSIDATLAGGALGPSISRVGNGDNNTAGDWVIQTETPEATNGNLNLPFSVGVGVPAPATSFSWSTGATTDLINVCPVGCGNFEYIVTILDSSTSCTWNDTALIEVLCAPDYTVQVDSVSCFGVCDGAIDLDIVGYDAGGSGQPVAFSSSPALFIPSNATVTDVINVAGFSGTLAAGQLVSVCLDITHTWDGDLDLTLEAPNGAQLALSLDNGGSADNYTNTCFTQTATQNIQTGSAPFTGNWIPEGGPLDNLVGVPVNGAWTLIITDQVGGDQGTLNTWSLEILQSGPTHTLTWNGPNGFSSTDLDNDSLCAGDYNLVITDETTGCQETATINVPEPDLLVVEMCADTQYVALGYGPESQAQLSQTTSGGTKAYSYLWSTGETTEFIYVRPDSTTDYTVVVTDYNGCTATATTTVVVIDVRCPSSSSKTAKSGSSKKEPKIMMCYTPNPKSPKSSHSSAKSLKSSQLPKDHCIKSEDVEGLINPVSSKSSAKSVKGTWRLGPCDFNGSFDNDDCGEPAWYECGCYGGLSEITVAHSAGSGQMILTGNSSKSGAKNLVVDNGDGTYTISAIASGSKSGSKSGCNKLKSNLTLTDGNGASASIHVSCSQDIAVGDVFGDYEIVSWVDCDGNYCQKQVTDKALVIDGSAFDTDVPGTEVQDVENGAVFESMPNPFNTSTTIKFTLETADHVSLVVYSANSTQVNTLFEGDVEANKTYEFEFAPADKASGMFISKLIMRSGSTLHQKLIMTR
jgi:subtilisin-like proprotein convertase family protein